MFSEAIYTAYGVFAAVATGNLLLMRRPGKPDQSPKIAFLIPARNEAENLRLLLAQLIPQGRVIVFDDESSDATAATARSLGAEVIEPKEPLPTGWTGKNRACYELGNSVQEGCFCFLDADVRVSSDFAAKLLSLAGPNRVVTGFPTIRHGRFPEPVVLGWVAWSLLALDPFFIPDRTGIGHGRFTNGQITLWPADLYHRLQPNLEVKGRILEDVLIGRLLAKNSVPVTVANLSGILEVKMYDDWRQAVDGMSKNSFEITGSWWGNALLALGMLLIAWAWVFTASPLIALGLLMLSSLSVSLICRANLLYVALLPLSLTVGAATLIRSWWWRRTGATTWKGRTYP